MTNKEYTVTHCHTMFSNGITNIDSVTKYDDYINEIKGNKSLNIKGICFTEHGSVFEWYKKKELCEKNGLKYIHSIEAYLTKTIDNKVRDNYHVCLYATNFESFKELNTLISKSFNREDGHYYYVPRITFEELKATSKDILITTACTGGVLAKADIEFKKEFLTFLIDNKDRCYLEQQHHLVDSQISYNKMLYEIHKNFDIPLIVATDTHSLNERHAKGRVILQKSKNIFFDNEEGWDLTLKSYDELVELFKKQNIMNDGDIYEALENTNRLYDRVQEFTLDKSYKYPKLWDNPKEVLQRKISEGILSRGVNKFDDFEIEYIPRIQHEMKTYEHNKAYDFLLLDEDIKTWARSKGMFCGYSRGSCSGSEIAYLIGMTDIDSIKHNMNFERFMNTERVSLADVDTDWQPNHREIIKKYIYEKEGLYCADIITFNTVALKGSIRDVGRALNIPLEEVSEISNNIELQEEKYRDLYPELFEYVDIINGTIVSIGSHPCGLICSPIPLDSNMGLCSISTNQNPISMISMKSIDAQNYVKLDILGLDTIQIINETCELANIDRLTPENVPDEEKVWLSMAEDNTLIFQWESDSAKGFLRNLLSEETISKIKEVNPNFRYLDLVTMGNGAIRPAGASYRNALSKGEFRDNGHYALNELLKATNGYLVYQEQILEFLNQFCGYTMGEADIVRRGFAKKTGTEQFIPKIKEGFIKTMKDKYSVEEAESEELVINFLDVIKSASDYLFSLNHSEPYTYIGYICAYLRYYYPLEFLTVGLNVNIGNDEKTVSITKYANKKDVQIKTPRFRYSNGRYMPSKSDNSIYKGIGSIKFLNEQVGNELYSLRNNKYNNFLELLLDILGDKTTIDMRQLDILIKIGFFSEFGGSKYLLDIVDMFNNIYSKKQFKKDNIPTPLTIEILKKYSNKETEKLFKEVNVDEMFNELISTMDNTKDISLSEIFKTEIEFVGYISYINSSYNSNVAVVTDIKLNKFGTPFATLYWINDGSSETIKIDKKYYNEKPISQFEVITTNNMEEKHKKRKIDGKWENLEETEKILCSYGRVIFE